MRSEIAAGVVIVVRLCAYGDLQAGQPQAEGRGPAMPLRWARGGCLKLCEGCGIAKLIKVLREVSTMVIERKVVV